MDNNFVQSSADHCLYTKCFFEEGNTPIYILVYVDDILVAAKSQAQIDEIETLLNQHFKINILGEVRHYLGLEVNRDKQFNFSIRQKCYIDKLLNEFGLQSAKISKFPLDPGYGKNKSESLNTNKDYQQLMGSLLYIAVNSRPDIAASISILAQKTNCPTKEDWNELKRVLRYLKGTSDQYLRMSFSVTEKNCLVGVVSLVVINKTHETSNN